MVELLGGWSNIVAELAQLDISDSVLTLCVSPLHARVAETAFDCFNEFKEDKNIDHWYEKAMEIDKPIVSAAATAITPASTGLKSRGGPSITGATKAAATPAPSSGRGGASSSFNLSTLDYIISQLSAMRLLICQYQYFLTEDCGLESLSSSEQPDMARWKEVEGVYVVLEGAYLSRAVGDAILQCREKTLLEVQKGVWVLQVGDKAVSVVLFMY